MTTLELPFISNLSYDPHDVWHLQEENTPDLSLCGVDLTGPGFIPGREIPDENKCPECLKIRDGGYVRV